MIAVLGISVTDQSMASDLYTTSQGEIAVIEAVGYKKEGVPFQKLP